jgi:hypothetical protein
MVPVTVGTQEILTFRTPGGRQFRFVVMITDIAALCCSCCHVNVSEKKTSNIIQMHKSRHLEILLCSMLPMNLILKLKTVTIPVIQHLQSSLQFKK